MLHPTINAMKFTSDYFDTIDDVARAKENDWNNVSDRRKRLKIIRKFTNMMNTMTPEEAEKLGRTEITNHGLTYNNMLRQETQYTSMATLTNALAEVIVDTDNPEQDTVVGLRIMEAVNKFAIHRKGKFANFWRKVAGEIVIAGGCPVTMPEKFGWLPRVRIDMFFPSETDLDADAVTYSFDPVEMSVKDLKEYAASLESRNSRFLNPKGIDKLLKKIKEQIATQTKYGISSESDDVTRGVRDRHNRLERNASISAFWYYEVRFEGGEQFVSATLCVDAVTGIELGNDGKLGHTIMVAHIPKAFSMADDWLHNVFVDSEIGGVKNVDSLKGVAEMTYPSNVEIEELLNLTLEGDKIRARPKVKILDNADPNKIKKWDIMRDTFAPPGIEEMDFKGTSRGLMTPMNLLSQTSAAMTSAPVSNGPNGGELRQQALERQQSNAAVQSARLAEAYNHLDAILEVVVHRLLAGPTKPGTSGYREIMCVRKRLDKYGIDYKKLAEREYGAFKHIRVRAKRIVGNGDLQQQIETSDWLMKNATYFPPGTRPLVIRNAVALRTQDPDLAEALVKVPQTVINNQRIVAENEYDTIKRRAALGQVLPTSDEDINQNHVETHLRDMQAHMALHQFRPWDMADVLAFAGCVEHVGMHLKNMQENPASAAEAKLYVQSFQQLVQQSQPIVKEVEDKQGSQDSQLTPQEQENLRLKWAQEHRKGIELGINMEDKQRLWSNREARATLSSRGQFVKEINDDRRLKLDDKKLALQAESTQKQDSND